MGRPLPPPLLLLLLLLLVQTYIPGKGWAPGPAPGSGSADRETGRAAEGGSEADEVQEEGSVPSSPAPIVILLVSPAPRGTAAGTR